MLYESDCVSYILFYEFILNVVIMAIRIQDILSVSESRIADWAIWFGGRHRGEGHRTIGCSTIYIFATDTFRSRQRSLSDPYGPDRHGIL